MELGGCNGLSQRARGVGTMCLLVVSALFGACDPSRQWDLGPGPCEGEVDATVELGGGTVETGFVSLEDGMSVRIALGPTGLWTVTDPFAFQVDGLYPGEQGRSSSHPADPAAWVTAEHAGTSVGGGYLHKGLFPTPMGSVGFGLFVVFESGEDLYGEPVTLELEVTDTCGRSAGDALDVIVAPPEGTAR